MTLGVADLARARAFYARLGWEADEATEGVAFIRLAGLVWPMGRELAAMSYLWRVPHAIDGRALESAVGALPATPVVAALRQALLDLGHGRNTAERALSSQA